MKMNALRPFYLGKAVVLPGEEFETQEIHGRQLARKNLAVPVKDAEPAPAKPAKDAKPPKAAAKPAAGHGK